jgi:hypothetical protein
MTDSGGRGAVIGRSVPVIQVAAQLGHSKKSLTLDTYSHVMPLDEVPVEQSAALLRP